MKNQILQELTPDELRIYINTLEKETEIMQKLATAKGFYDEYFKALKNVKYNYEAFNLINERYFNVFGQYRYSDYSSFEKI